MVSSNPTSSPAREKTTASVTAIVLAGERPEGDPLASHYGVAAKALVPVGGAPMGVRVVATLRAWTSQVRVLGNPAKLATLGGLEVEASGATIAATLAPLVAAGPWPMLVTTADHPLLDRVMLATFAEQAEGCDLAVGLVERRTLLARHPDSRRTWLRFRGGAYSGANLFWIGSDRALPLLGIWASVEQQRKRGRALIGAFGFPLLLGVGLRLLTLQGALSRIGRRFNLKARAVVLPQAEACIDVDKPEDRDLVERILGLRE